MAKEKIDIRDLRDGKFLWIDKAALNLVSQKAGSRGVAVYSWLCYYANAKHQDCFPSVTTLAEHCHVSRRTIMRTVKALERIRAISIERTKGKPNVYKLLNLPVDKTGDTVVTSDMDDTTVVTPVSPPLVTPQTLEQDLTEQELTNKTEKPVDNSPCLFPEEEPEALRQLVSWRKRLLPLVDLHRLLLDYREMHGQPPDAGVVIDLCKQFDREKARIKSAKAWFRTAITAQMRQASAKRNITEHKRMNKEPVQLGLLLEGMHLAREPGNGSFPG